MPKIRREVAKPLDRKLSRIMDDEAHTTTIERLALERGRLFALQRTLGDPPESSSDERQRDVRGIADAGDRLAEAILALEPMTEKDLLIYAVMLLDEATCDLIDANTPDNLVEAINSMCKSVVRGVIRITGLRPADVGLEAYESALS